MSGVLKQQQCVWARDEWNEWLWWDDNDLFCEMTKIWMRWDCDFLSFLQLIEIVILQTSLGRFSNRFKTGNFVRQQKPFIKSTRFDKTKPHSHEWHGFAQKTSKSLGQCQWSRQRKRFVILHRTGCGGRAVINPYLRWRSVCSLAYCRRNDSIWS